MGNLQNGRSYRSSWLKWMVAVLSITVLFGAALLGLRCWAPGVWAELTTGAQLANAVVSIFGSLVGALIAVGAAYAILREQVGADRQLELDLRVADVAHEVAGEISYWRDSLPDPVRSVEGGKALDPSVVRALVQRRDRLESHGIPALEILGFVRLVERDLMSLQATYDSICRRLPTNGNQWGLALASTFAANLEVSSEWQSKVVPQVDALDKFATALANWHPGEPVPTVALPSESSLVCSMIDIEKRLAAAGHKVPRDTNAATLGLYDDVDDAGGPEAAEHADE